MIQINQINEILMHHLEIFDEQFRDFRRSGLRKCMDIKP